MSRAEDYVAATGDLLDDSAAAAIEALPDDAWPAVLTALTYLVPGATHPGIDCDVASTYETLADFDGARLGHWDAMGSRVAVTCGALPAVLYDDFRLFPGAASRRMVVLDLGARRLALVITEDGQP